MCELTQYTGQIKYSVCLQMMSRQLQVKSGRGYVVYERCMSVMRECMKTAHLWCVFVCLFVCF